MLGGLGCKRHGGNVGAELGDELAATENDGTGGKGRELVGLTVVPLVYGVCFLPLCFETKVGHVLSLCSFYSASRCSKYRFGGIDALAGGSQKKSCTANAHPQL